MEMTQYFAGCSIIWDWGREIRLNKKPKIRIEFNETRCHNHLIYGDGIKTGQGGVSGAHNKNNFYKTLNDKFEPIFRKEGLEFSASDCIEGSIVHPKIPGVEQIRYKLPAMNQNNTVNQGVYKKIKAPKTVYDPSVISDEQMLQWGKEVNYRNLRGLSEEEIPIVEQK